MKPSRTPLVTLLLLLASLCAAFAGQWYPDEILETFGFHASRPGLLTALSSLFLHANTPHLLGNMVFLAAVGPTVEGTLGSWRLAFAYFVGGLAGVGVHWAMASQAQTTTPLVGASGAIAACVALFTVRFMRLRVPLAPKVSVPLVAVTGLWLALQVMGAFVRLGAIEGGIAYWAHIGGFGGGLLLGLVLRTPQQASREIAVETLSAMSQRSPAAALAAAESQLKHRPADPNALREMAEACHLLADHHREATAWIRLLDVLPLSEKPLAVQRLEACGGLSQLPPIQRLKLADRVRPESPESAAILLESVVAGPIDAPELPDALLSLADIQRERVPERAQAAVVRLFEQFPMHPAADVARAKGWKP